MNMRDYRRSTPYSTEEVVHITSPDLEVQTSAVPRFGQEIAKFILYICEIKGIPQVIMDGKKKSGGLALMTWLLSNIGLLSILDDPDTLADGKIKSTLACYLRKAILYGVSSLYENIDLLK